MKPDDTLPVIALSPALRGYIVGRIRDSRKTPA